MIINIHQLSIENIVVVGKKKLETHNEIEKVKINEKQVFCHCYLITGFKFIRIIKCIDWQRPVISFEKENSLWSFIVDLTENTHLSIVNIRIKQTGD